MKWLTTLAALVAVLAVAGTSAAGSAAKDPRVPALQKQVAALTSQATTLQAQVQHDELVVTCGFATQQAYNIANLNLWATVAGMAPYSGPAPNDGGACAKLGLPAPSARSLAAHSPVGALQALIRKQSLLVQAR
jgi:hypothetical protein